jgi:hypothetical protein
VGDIQSACSFGIKVVDGEDPSEIRLILIGSIIRIIELAYASLGLPLLESGWL